MLKFKLIKAKTYQGRHRSYVTDDTQALSNYNSSITYTDFDVVVTSMQPISGFTLQAVDEGYRSKAQYTFWTETEVFPLMQGTDQVCDQIQIDGLWYSIYSLGDWRKTTVMNHLQCVAILDDQDNSWSTKEGGDNYGGFDS